MGLEHIPDAIQQTLHDFCFRNIAYGSIIHTDGVQDYQGLANYGYITACSRTRSSSLRRRS